jgi:hypothetical protein
MEQKEKTNPTAYVKALVIFLDRLLVKKIIPIPFEDAVQQVLFDMDSMFEDEDNRQAFRKVIGKFQEMTNLEGWYEGEYDNL